MILLQDHGDKHSLVIKLMHIKILMIQQNGEELFLAKLQDIYMFKQVHQQIKLILVLLSMVEDSKFQTLQPQDLIFQLLEDQISEHGKKEILIGMILKLIIKQLQMFIGILLQKHLMFSNLQKIFGLLMIMLLVLIIKLNQ